MVVFVVDAFQNRITTKSAGRVRSLHESWFDTRDQAIAFMFQRAHRDIAEAERDVKRKKKKLAELVRRFGKDHQAEKDKAASTREVRGSVG